MTSTQTTVGTAGFAVVDVETTGFGHEDRIVEVAVVHLSPDGEITDEFATLINPVRAVGATRIHGITASDVAQAPPFAAASAAVWRMLAGRVLVAHNASFDRRFLEAEFNRCGASLASFPAMCTMQMSDSYLSNLPSRKLPDCCHAAGIELSGHHSALADARATARLLAYYRGAHRNLPGAWRTALGQAARTALIPGPAAVSFRAVPRQRRG